MEYTITDTSGNILIYNQDTGLISKNGNIVSSTSYEAVFTLSVTDKDAPPKFSGILFKNENKVLSLSGNLRDLINPKLL